MFSLLAGFWTLLFSRPNIHILLIGIDYAGKTTLLEKIKTIFGKNQVGLPPEKIPPTVGMNLAKIKHKGSQVIFWDLGGQTKIRSMWEKYYDEADAVIYVVDSADSGRLDEAKYAYSAAIDHDLLTKVPVITLANKQDVPGSLPASDLVINFSPRTYAVSALTGDGVEAAIEAVLVEAKRRAASRGPV